MIRRYVSGAVVVIALLGGTLACSATQHPGALSSSGISENPISEKHSFQQTDFKFLSGYQYILAPDAEVAQFNDVPNSYRGQIPDSVLALNGKEVAVEGYMVPFKVEKGQVMSFVLVRDKIFCCGGLLPEMNEWIHVTLEKGREIPPSIDNVIRVYGRIEVGEKVEDGMIESLYRMNAGEVRLRAEERQLLFGLQSG